jgi:hypothetical protein
MFKVALATTVCYDKSCINYKKAINKDLLRNPQIRFRNKDSTKSSTPKLYLDCIGSYRQVVSGHLVSSWPISWGVFEMSLFFLVSSWPVNVYCF